MTQLDAARPVTADSLHLDVDCVGHDELDLVIVVTAFRCSTFYIGVGDHEGKTALGNRHVVIVVPLGVTVERLGEIAVVVTNVQADANAVANLKAVVE